MKKKKIKKATNKIKFNICSIIIDLKKVVRS